MKLTLACLALAFLPVLAQAKCVELTYSLEGQILDDSGRPAAGAFVGASWIEFGQAGGPAFAVANRDGRYRLYVRYRPGDDMPLFGAACRDRLTHVNVIAYAGDQRSYPTQVAISGLNQKMPSIKVNEPAAGAW